MRTKSRRFKDALDAAKKPWGCGWDLLTKDMQDALLAQQAVFLLLAQDPSMTQFEPAKNLVKKALGLLED